MLIAACILAQSLGAAPAAQRAPRANRPPRGPARGGDVLIVRSGETFLHDTLDGPLVFDDVVIEPGGLFRVQGPKPFGLCVTNRLLVAGTLDVSGFGARDVHTLNTGNVPEPGAAGAAGGGQGGTGSPVTDDSSPKGGDGSGGFGHANGGGAGGESAFAVLQQSNWESRRPAGGGGGALAANQPEPGVIGLAATDGGAGHPNAQGVCSGMQPPRGGAAGTPVFVDGDPTNDFWGLRFDRVAGRFQEGELRRPVPGSGAGAGGDALTQPFPPPSWTPAQDEKAGAGGGGGGLAYLFAHEIVVTRSGRICSNGGRGANGEHTNFTNSIGGEGGGGSGGYLILEAELIDLREAAPDAITALGGLGGQGDPRAPGTNPGLGGNGGPGVIQLHTPGGRGVLVDPLRLTDVTTPTAHVLLKTGATNVAQAVAGP